jgi:hypothetical protein
MTGEPKGEPASGPAAGFFAVSTQALQTYVRSGKVRVSCNASVPGTEPNWRVHGDEVRAVS